MSEFATTAGSLLRRFQRPIPPAGRHALETGDKDRQTYLAKRLATAVTDPNDPRSKTVLDVSTYYSNNGIDKNTDVQPIGRIGVYGLDGITEPQTTTIPVSFVPVPPALRRIITSVILSGKNILPPVLAFSDASLKAMNVVPVLLNQVAPLPLLYENLSGGSLEATNLKVARGITVATNNFTAMPVDNNLKDGRLSVKISTFDRSNEQSDGKSSKAYEAMVFELSKYEREIEQSVTKCKSPSGSDVYFGMYSLQTPRSVLCVRGNLFIEMTIVDTTKPDKNAFDLVIAMMGRLDDYLNKHAVRYSQTRRPSLAMMGVPPPNELVNVKTEFSVHMRDIDLLARDFGIFIDKARVIVRAESSYTIETTGPQQKHRFLVRKTTFPKVNDLVSITITGAHPDTFYPGSATFKVHVRHDDPMEVEDPSDPMDTSP